MSGVYKLWESVFTIVSCFNTQTNEQKPEVKTSNKPTENSTFSCCLSAFSGTWPEMSSGSCCCRALIMLFNPLLCVCVLTYFCVITRFSSRTQTNTFSMTLAYTLLRMLYYYKIFPVLQAILLIHRT